jgi:hypothetical protein
MVQSLGQRFRLRLEMCGIRDTLHEDQESNVVEEEQSRLEAGESMDAGPLTRLVPVAFRVPWLSGGALSPHSSPARLRTRAPYRYKGRT